MDAARVLESAIATHSTERASEMAEPLPTFEEIYDRHAEFVWSSLRGLGVHADAVDDAAQDVFVVLHRRLGDYNGRSTLKTFVFGIAVGIARNYRRAARRAGRVEHVADVQQIADPRPTQLDSTAAAQAMARLVDILDRLDDAKREVLVAIEWEQMSAPEIAAALGVSVNTVYSRLRLARAEFDRLLERFHRREGGP
jgi:RNA polymerase sigma-70 factor (ECF subfamily)